MSPSGLRTGSTRSQDGRFDRRHDERSLRPWPKRLNATNLVTRRSLRRSTTPPVRRPAQWRQALRVNAAPPFTPRSTTRPDSMPRLERCATNNSNRESPPNGPVRHPASPDRSLPAQGPQLLGDRQHHHHRRRLSAQQYSLHYSCARSADCPQPVRRRTWRRPSRAVRPPSASPRHCHRAGSNRCDRRPHRCTAR